MKINIEKFTIELLPKEIRFFPIRGRQYAVIYEPGEPTPYRAWWVERPIADVVDSTPEEALCKAQVRNFKHNFQELVYWFNDDHPHLYKTVGVAVYDENSMEVRWQIQGIGLLYDTPILVRDTDITVSIAEWANYQQELLEDGIAYENDLLPDQSVDSDPDGD